MRKRTTILMTALLFAAAFLSAQSSKVFTVKGVPFKMVFVKGGTFQMGATKDMVAENYERPAHQVTVSDFWMGETEVTQALWYAVKETSVSLQCKKAKANLPKVLRSRADTICPMVDEGDDYPMCYVNWDEAVSFCHKLNELLHDQLPIGYCFALPTEAEWEYAARGGQKKSGYKYAGGNSIDDVGWCFSNSGKKVHGVKRKNANALGLYDMSGNVREWCSDLFDANYYRVSPSVNPKGSDTVSDVHVVRGGSVFVPEKYCTVYKRSETASFQRAYFMGFRLALAKENDSKVVVDDIEYDYDRPTDKQLQQWKKRYESVCWSKVKNMNHQEYWFYSGMLDNDPCLVYLILKAGSLTKEDKQEWFDLYASKLLEMDSLYLDTKNFDAYLVVRKEFKKQFDKLCDILYRENHSVGILLKARQFNSDAYKYAGKGDFNNAYLLINKAIALDPKDANYYDSKGEFYLMQGRIDDALAMWRKVLELDPKFLAKNNGHTNLYDGLVAKGRVAPR